jgi:hypothetical protein
MPGENVSMKPVATKHPVCWNRHDSQYLKYDNQSNNHLGFPYSLARRFCLRVHPNSIGPQLLVVKLARLISENWTITKSGQDRSLLSLWLRLNLLPRRFKHCSFPN